MSVSTSDLYSRLRSLPEETKGALVALPPVVYILLFFILPLLTILNYSIRVQESLQITNQITAEHYVHVLTSGTFRGALFYSVSTALITMIITLVLGLPLGYYLAVKASERYRNVLLFLVIAPLFVNFFVRAYALIQLGSPKGFINGVLISVGVINQPIEWLIYSQPAVIFGLASLYLPLMVLPVYAMLRQVNPDWYEAARDLGAGQLQIHREITLPTALSGIILGSLFVFLLTLGNQAVPRILGGAKDTTYPEAILLQLEGSVNWPVASAASGLMMFLIILVLVGVFTVFDVEELF
jgi:ABC-type spermidine/putrescine transport system permease subunit I